MDGTALKNMITLCSVAYGLFISLHHALFTFFYEWEMDIRIRMGLEDNSET